MNTLGLSAHEYMARQVNYTQGLRLPSNHYIFHNVRSIPSVNGLATAVSISPNKQNGARFHGTREFKYWRTDLSTISGGTYLIPSGYVPTTRAQLLQFVNAQLGLTLTVDDIVDSNIDDFTTPYTVQFVSKTTSLLYKGTFSAVFMHALEQALPVRVLNGFIYPDSQAASVNVEDVSQYLEKPTSHYRKTSIQKNDEVVLWTVQRYDALEDNFVVEFGCALRDTQRVTALLGQYRLTLSIDLLDDAMDQKFFLKDGDATNLEVAWRAAFDSATLPLTSMSDLPTVARGRFVLPKRKEPVKISMTAKPLRVIWIPTLETEINFVTDETA